MNSKEKLVSDISSDESVKRIKALEVIIDKDENIKKLLNEKKLVSKQMVAAKQLELFNTYNEYLKRYNEIDEEIANYPFVLEYMELLEEKHNDLEIMINYIEKKINDELN